MQFIKSIENSIESKSLKFKIELFIFPIFMLMLIYILFFNDNKSVTISKIKTIDKSSIKMKAEIIDILKDIENYTLKEHIYLDKISNDTKKIDIEVLGDLKKRLEFFNYIENYNSFSKIDSFEFSENRLRLTITFDKFYRKTKVNVNEYLEKLHNKNESSYYLKAIVDNRVLINEKWLDKDDFIDNLKVLKIESNNVTLQNRFKSLVLKLYKDE